ncbi:hypothetical protein MKY20_23930 [Cytobacillus sp. FSL W8-0315]|uniref:hypothetical protein n=1 Tax=Cytobacillus TaxID=2675230 RepID=UPI0001F458DF|nr:hypothetical protein [Cytobacillus pseudoceanisediminis]EFV74692.1 hypothetical protein HMPREF1013_05149 [Bacillus sp. 2_A_57_CT2]UQX56891.1 DUF4871 domain-containing protein [Cytobacillus pseudoceanisediminis]
MFIKSFVSIISIIVILTTVGCTNKNEESVTTNVENKNLAQKWNQSPLFKSGNYTMIGEKGRLGFIYDDSEAVRFYPNKTQKYMWHFWGEDQEFNGKLKVVAIHENDEKQITVVEGGLGGDNNGADRHAPSNMSLPKSGMWKLDVYIGDKLFGSVYVKVHKK